MLVEPLNGLLFGLACKFHSFSIAFKDRDQPFFCNLVGSKTHFGPEADLGAWHGVVASVKSTLWEGVKIHKVSAHVTGCCLPKSVALSTQGLGCAAPERSYSQHLGPKPFCHSKAKLNSFAKFLDIYFLAGASLGRT